MSEEDNKTNTEEVIVNPIEEKALAAGWKPQEEWEGDPSDWRDAKSFLDRGELLSEIHKQKRTVKELRVILDDMKNHISNLTKQQHEAYERALKNKRKELIDEGNSAEVDKVDRMIEEIKKHTPKVEQGPSPSDQQRIQEIFTDFKTKNAWFETDPEMTAEANQLSRLEMSRIEQEYIKSTGRQKTYFTPDEAEEVFDLVSKEIRKRFPTKFKNPKKDTPLVVESTSSKPSSNSKGKVSMKDVPEEYKTIIKKFVRQGIMTEQEYVDMLKAQGVI